jgi:AraC family transcriptional regulator of adaptative response/methylated-DNA-[protein]-cysteine methyltransferase
MQMHRDQSDSMTPKTIEDTMTKHSSKPGPRAPRAPNPELDARWLAVRSRDKAADTRFVYAVRTTGVYCHPSSPTRLPDPRNVEFFDSAAAAEAAGYRPSRRPASDPDALHERHVALVAQACRRLAEESPTPSLSELALSAGLSPYHFHRLFKTIAGLTPKGFALAQRALQTRKHLRVGTSVTQAIYDSGFDSNARFYANTDHMLGMTPTAYRAGGTDTNVHFAVGQCTLGAVLVAQSARGVCAILLGEDPQALVRELQDHFPKANLIGADHNFEQLVARVVGLIESPSMGLDLPLDLRGTVFQMRVWQALREIPPGTTATYAQIAQRIGAPKSVRAVAGACGANRLAVAIPCHRVVRSDGTLSGYRWGVERKRQLLQRESDSAS